MTNAPLIFTPDYYERMRALESDSWWNAAMRDVAAMLLDLAKLPAAGLMLDVGCGSGQTAAWFHGKHPQWRVGGLDIAPEGLQHARDLGLPVSRASALHLPYRDGCADVVITFDVLQHLPLDGGDLHGLREMRRVLKGGGVLLLRTNAQAFPRTPDDARFQFHRYEPDELTEKIERSGFSVLRLGRVNALLGLAEIPRELRASRTQPSAYHGILARPARASGLAGRIKRRWLRLEGQLLRMGVQLPLGRTMLAVCRAV